MPTLLPFLRALCGLARDRAISLSCVLVLALGIGAFTAFGTALHRVVLAPLPFADSARLVAVEEVRHDGRPLGVSLASLRDFGAQASCLRDLREVSMDQPARPTVYLSLGQFPSEGATYVLRAPPRRSAARSLAWSHRRWLAEYRGAA